MLEAMLKRLLARITNVNIPLAAAALFAGGILHILTTLATPALTPTSGYDRLARDVPLNSMVILPAVAPDTQVLPFMSPDARYAVCRFDTADGAVRLTAVLPEPGWVLALYSPAGDNFFSSVAQPGRRTDVSISLVPGDDTWRTVSPNPAVQAAQARDPTLTIPANSGLAVLRAPDQGDAYRGRALAELKRAKCQYRKK
jgi:uncharacterized membrane protein